MKNYDYKVDDRFTYQPNEFGCRYQIPSDNSKKIVCLGCSNTYGCGVFRDETWPYFLEKKMMNKYEVLNMGLPGSGVDHAFKHYKMFCEELKPKKCILQVPSFIRVDGGAHDFNDFFLNRKVGFRERVKFLKKRCPGLIDRNLEIISDFCDVLFESRVEPIFLLYNYYHFNVKVVEMREYYKEYFEKLNLFLEKNNVKKTEIIDSLWMLKNKYLIDDIHPNKEGHFFMANKVFDIIGVEDGIVLQTTNRSEK